MIVTWFSMVTFLFAKYNVAKVVQQLGGSSQEVRGSWKQLASAKPQGGNEPCWPAPDDLGGDSDEKQAKPSLPLCL